MVPERDLVEAIWQAVEEGDGERAGRLARKLRPDDDDLDGRMARGVGHLEAGEFAEARQWLEGLAGSELDPDAEYLRRWYLAQSLFSLGEARLALDHFEGLQPASALEAGQNAWWCGLCEDHLGESERADRSFEKAAELDPEGAPRPVPISAEAVERWVQEIAESLPADLHRLFDEVPVVVQDLPPLDLVRNSGGQVHPDTLGLYVGLNLLETSHLYSSGLPPAIYIFRRNLERFIEKEEDARREIRITLLHELGHHLGYEEADLDRLGLA